MIGTVLRTGSQSHFTYHTLHCIRRLALLTNRSAVQASKLPALLHGMASSCLSTPKHSKAGNCVACGVCSRCLSPNCREPGNHPRVKGEHSAKIKALYREDYHNAAVTVVRRGEDRQQAISPSLNEDILFAPITEAMVQAEERDRPPTPSNLLERLFNCLRESFDNLAHSQQHRAASFTLEQLRSNVSSRRDALTMATSALETLLLGITGSDEAARLELEPRCGNAHQFVLFLRVTWPWTNSPTFS